jgi:hypothetical protein
MFVAFQELPDNARVWVYTCAREVSEKEAEIAQNYVSQQIEQWAAHGNNLAAGCSVVANRFVVLALDEDKAQASGCSIDASGRWFKVLGEHFQTDFLSRDLIYMDSTGQQQSVGAFQTKQAVTSGKITEYTLVYNTLVTSLGQFRTDFMVAARNSWLNKYFEVKA